MIYKIVALRDRAADVFSVPQFVPSIGAAVRSFGDAINSKSEEALCKHPEDFDLFELGSFDDNEGTFNVHVPRQVAVGKDMVRP